MTAYLPLTYENYIFDLYGTLVDIHTDESCPRLWEKLSLFFGYYGARYSANELRHTWDERTAQCRGQAYEAFPEIDVTVIIRALFEQKGVAPSLELIHHTGQFFRILSTEYIRLYDGTRELLDGLRNAGKHIWLLSNAQRIFTRYELRMLDIDRCFDSILISSDFGVAKPDPRFFRQLNTNYSIDFSRSLFIGNDAVNDVGGAVGVGLDSFYVHSNLSSIAPSWLSEEAKLLTEAADFEKASAPDAPAVPLRFRLGDTTNETVMNFTGWGFTL
ncbi:MAG: HAD family hydrolase [Lachnospiraceae bacterium]|nr:HAD family hydrolase [Lachnospiraceae bacterium]